MSSIEYFYCDKNFINEIESLLCKKGFSVSRTSENEFKLYKNNIEIEWMLENTGPESLCNLHVFINLYTKRNQEQLEVYEEVMS